jgi:hypothetical protein
MVSGGGAYNEYWNLKKRIILLTQLKFILNLLK